METTESKIWLSSPHMGGTELRYIHDAFEENWVAPLGPNVAGFEQDLEAWLGEDVHVAALSSGTAALHLALSMLGVHRGEYVICQTLTFCASANPILYLNANPVFVDSESDTWNMCPRTLEEAIIDKTAKGRKPKAIIIAHLYGMPAKMDELLEVAERYDIPLIEDAAEALGSTYKGRACGTLGPLAILSFNGNKIITTSGGGALVARQKKYKRRAIYLATQAREPAPHYEHTHLGYNYRLSNVCAGIGRGQMEVLEERVAQRRANHFFYRELLKDVPGVSVFSEPDPQFYSNHWLSAILIEPQLTGGLTAQDLRVALERHNIEARPLAKPMHIQPLYEKAPYYGADIAENLFSRGICLPSGSNMNEVQRGRVADVIKRTFTL